MGEEFNHLRPESQHKEMDVSRLWHTAIIERGSICFGLIVTQVPRGQPAHLSLFI